MAPTILSSGNVITNPGSVIPPAGATTLVVISHCADNLAAGTPTAVTWGTAPLEKRVDRDEAIVASAMWTLYSPANVTSNLGWSGGTSVRSLFHIWLSGIARMRSVGSNAGTGASLQVTVNSSNDELILYGVSISANEAMSAVGGVTELDENTNANGHAASGWEAGTAPSATGGFSWTTSVAAAGVAGGFGAVGGDQIIMVAIERWKRLLRDLKAGLVPPDQLRRRYGNMVQI